MSLSEQELREVLRAYELRLLRCTLSPPTSPSKSQPDARFWDNRLSGLHANITELLSSIEAGNYFQALYSDAAKLVTESPEVDSPDLVFSELVERCVGNDTVDVEERACKAVLVLCVAVAAFFCFTQINFTGPLIELPKTPLRLGVSDGRDFEEWNNWARNQLMADGSDLLGKLSNLQYIVFAKMLVMGTKDLLFEGNISAIYGIRSISWWLARILLIQQRLMDERSSSLFDLLQVSIGETLQHFGAVEAVTSYWGSLLCEDEATTIVTTAYLESGVVEHTYGRVEPCRLHFKSAENVAGLQLSVTGVLGYRTVHQAEPKAQMVLVANKHLSDGSSHSIDTTLPDQRSVASENNSDLQRHETSESSDVLMMPMLLDNGCNEKSGHVLKPVQQAVILAHCLLIESSSRNDESQGWDRAPYIEAIDSQSSSPFTLRCFCELMRIRWESTRSRTKERALEMMETLVGSLNKPFPPLAQRILFSYSTYVPCISALRKEYGELLVSIGLTGEAIRIFEDLELWDSLIFCYQLLGKKAAAVELIKKRLTEVPNDPRLWCSLGDVTNNDRCYEKALEVSNDKSVRAKRSLARSAYNRGDFESSKILWESAMALNSLYPDGWFALGAAALKARDVDKALDGFTRAVQLDPENGESWNNIACLHMIKKKSKEAFIAFKEALKIKRDSWQMWDNFSQVALDTDNYFQALEAIQMVMQMTNCKRVDCGLLERIMLELERRTHLVDSDVDSMDGSRDGRSRETEQLMDLLGKILQQSVRTESRADMWGLYAKWLKIKGDLTMCSEALLKQVRSYQGSDLWKDKDRFKKFARASMELCKVYLEISSSTVSRRELFSAEMQLKNIVKQGESFSDTEEFRDVQACLDEVRRKLET